jgi:hypothetical protein
MSFYTDFSVVLVRSKFMLVSKEKSALFNYRSLPPMHYRPPSRGSSLSCACLRGQSSQPWTTCSRPDTGYRFIREHLVFLTLPIVPCVARHA